MVCECGERLLAAVGEETITTVEGERMVFRRQSDYVLCPNCLRLYSVTQLRAGEENEFVALSESGLAELAGPEDHLPLEDQFR